MILISGAEFERRVRRTSQLRALCLRLKHAALEQWRQGTFPVRPKKNIRSDVEYWRARAAEAAAPTKTAAAILEPPPGTGPGLAMKEDTSDKGATS